jgi:hypothetical protein
VKIACGEAIQTINNRELAGHHTLVNMHVMSLPRPTVCDCLCRLGKAGGRGAGDNDGQLTMSPNIHGPKNDM